MKKSTRALIFERVTFYQMAMLPFICFFSLSCGSYVNPATDRRSGEGPTHPATGSNADLEVTGNSGPQNPKGPVITSGVPKPEALTHYYSFDQSYENLVDGVEVKSTLVSLVPGNFESSGALFSRPPLSSPCDSNPVFSTLSVPKVRFNISTGFTVSFWTKLSFDLSVRKHALLSIGDQRLVFDYPNKTIMYEGLKPNYKSPLEFNFTSSYHIVLVQSPDSGIEIYIDGAKLTNSLPQQNPSNLQDSVGLVFGNVNLSPNQGAGFIGKISKVAIWGSPLTSEEVTIINKFKSAFVTNSFQSKESSTLLQDLDGDGLNGFD